MPQDFQRYLIRKVFYLALIVFLVLSFNFLLFRVMPGDVARILIPKGASNETIEHLTEYYGLDKSMPEQYLTYLGQTFTGKLGESITVYVGSSVESILWPALVNTLILVGLGTIISIYLGVYLGREAAWRRGKAVDKIGNTFFLIFFCMPTFLFALVMITFVAKYSSDWPIKGAFSPEYEGLDIISKLGDRTVHTIIPLFALVIESIATFSIITRSSLIDVMTEEYMVTAVAKGLPSRGILHNHAMPNAMLPIVTVVAMEVGWVLSGAIMIEVVFSYQGLGWLTWRAVIGHDYPILQAVFMLEAVAVIVANFMADLMLFKLDPRVRT